MATHAPNNHWEDQPRDPETGRFWRRADDWAKRDQVIKIRLTEEERRRIEEAAKAADQSMTGWLMEAIRRHAAQPPPMATATSTIPAAVSSHQRQLYDRLHRQHRRH